MATRVSMRCVFDVQHTPGTQSTFHRSCSSITCELLSAEMFQMARAVDNKRQQTCAVLLLLSLYSLLPHCYPCTISLLYHPTFDSPSPFPVKSTSQSDRLVNWTGSLGGILSIRSFSSHSALAQQFFLSFLCYLFGVP